MEVSYKKKIIYSDKIFFPFLVVLMCLINLYIVFPSQLFSHRFLVALAEDSLECLICWMLLRNLIFRLDKTLPYQGGFLWRLMIQLIASLIICCGMLILMTIVLHYILIRGPIPNEMYTHHIWVFAFWVIIQNAIYLIMYLINFEELLNFGKSVSHNVVQAKRDIEDINITIKAGNKTILVNKHDIFYLTISNGYVICCESTNEIHLVDYTLDEIQNMLPSSMFYRLNRQYIINKKLINSYETVEDRKLKVELKEVAGLPNHLFVSRIKAAAFKFWLKGY